jgi:hypothetical protein
MSRRIGAMRAPHETARDTPLPGLAHPRGAAPELPTLRPLAASGSAWPCLRARFGAALGVLLWVGFATWRLGSVPGMSMDEAWSILSARGEWPPDNPLSGMTSYAGPFPVLLLEVFGTDVGLWGLRAAGVLANAALLLVLAALLRRLYPARSILSWALPVLATTPVWLVTLRTGIEVTMFTPLCSVLGLYLLVLGSRRAAFAAGLVWGLLVYNHVIGLAFPVAVAAAWLAVYRRFPPLAWRPLLLGAALGLAPRLAALALFHDRALGGYAARYEPWAAIKDLIWLPKALWETWHGETVYRRYVGRIALGIWPYGLLLAGFAVPWWRRPRRIPRAAWFVLLASLGTAVLVTVGAPYIAVRFLVLPLLGLSTFFVLLGAAALVDEPRWGRLVRGTAFALAACQLFYAVADFYLPWRQQKLGVTTFFLGARSKRASSWAYLPKEALVRELLALSPPPEQIITQPSIERPLRALLHGSSLRARLASDAEPGKRSVFIDYDRPPLADPFCLDVGTSPRCFHSPTPVGGYFVLYREE